MNAEQLVAWKSVQLEDGYRETVRNLADSLRNTYYLHTVGVKPDVPSQDPEQWERMAEAAIRHIWFFGTEDE